MFVFDHSLKEELARVESGGETFVKYQASFPDRTFWWINNSEVWYDDERFYDALDEVVKLTEMKDCQCSVDTVPVNRELLKCVSGVLFDIAEEYPYYKDWAEDIAAVLSGDNDSPEPLGCPRKDSK